MWWWRGDVAGDYSLAGCELTDATASLDITQVLQLDLGVDFCATAFQPCQENGTGLIKGVHDCKVQRDCVSRQSEWEVEY